jgi:hypothetical protein
MLWCDSCEEGFSGRSCGFTASESSLRSQIQESAMQRLADLTIAAVTTVRATDFGCASQTICNIAASHMSRTYLSSL